MTPQIAVAAEVVHQLVQDSIQSSNNALLNVACGTELYTSYLRKHYQMEGLDLDMRMIEAVKVEVAICRNGRKRSAIIL